MHDRSDGGLFTTLVEMAFAGHCGLTLESQRSELLTPVSVSMKSLGLCCRLNLKASICGRKPACSRPAHARLWGRRNRISRSDFPRFATSRVLCAGRARPAAGRRSAINCRAFAIILSVLRRRSQRLRMTADPGLSMTVPAGVTAALLAPMVQPGVKPKVAILREQGVNSQWKWRPRSRPQALKPLMCI